MNLVELDRALRQLRLSGMAAVLDTRLRQAQAEKMPPIDLTDRRRRRGTVLVGSVLTASTIQSEPRSNALSYSSAHLDTRGLDCANLALGRRQSI